MDDAVSRPIPHRARRRRWILAALVVPTIATGLLVHRGDGVVADVAGDALYAVLIYLVAAVLLLRAPRAVPVAVAIAFCSGIELLQLTGLPLSWSRAFPPAALVFGTGFDLRDLLVYAAAIVLAASLDALLSQRFSGKAA